MIEKRVIQERQQLLGHWKRILAKRPNWAANNFSQVKRIALLKTTTPSVSNKSLGGWLRAFHDKLGYMAKNELRHGGLCAGTLYRSQLFIETENRSGARRQKTQNVHVEHTVPIKVLRDLLRECSFASDTEALVWLLKHSVATALRFGEQDTLTGLQSSTSAFDATSLEHQKPFMRYKALFDRGGVIWNVYDATIISPDLFTFDNHLENVFRLLAEAGADQEMLGALAAHVREHQSAPI